jgi:hypothetical protein
LTRLEEMKSFLSEAEKNIELPLITFEQKLKLTDILLYAQYLLLKAWIE